MQGIRGFENLIPEGSRKPEGSLEIRKPEGSLEIRKPGGSLEAWKSEVRKS
jgi:hypothetical protein